MQPTVLEIFGIITKQRQLPSSADWGDVIIIIMMVHGINFPALMYAATATDRMSE